MADYPSGITYDAGGLDLSIVVPEGSTLEGGVDLHGTANLTAILNGASVTTTADGDTGVSLHSDSGDLIVAVQDLTTAGDFADGVNAVTETGSISITSGIKGGPGSIVTHGDSSYGIHAITGTGDVSVLVDDVTTTGNYSVGVSVVSREGSVSFENNVGLDPSVISTDGNWSTGIVAVAGSDVTVGSETIVTKGDNSYGILANSAYGAITIDSQSITTEGVNSQGIHAAGEDGPTSITSGMIETLGDGAHGIVAFTHEGDLTIKSDTVLTHGDSADGILAVSLGGEIVINSGSVVTDGGARVLGTYDDGSFTVYNNDTPAIGIVAVNYSRASTTITSDSVSTNGASAIGILAEGYGDVTVTSGSVVTTGGQALYSVYHGDGTRAYEGASTGILAYSRYGQTTVTSNSVETSGDNASGIIAESGSFFAGRYGQSSGDTGTTVVAGDVATHGAFAYGIAAISFGGDVSVDFNTVQTDGTSSRGLLVNGIGTYNLQTGETSFGDVNIHGGSIMTAGDIGTGLYAQVLGGDINVDVAEIHTSGDFSNAFIVEANAARNYAAGELYLGNVNVTVDQISTEGFGSTAAILSGHNDVNATLGSIVTSGDFSFGVGAFAYQLFDYFHDEDSGYTAGSGWVFGGDVNLHLGSVETHGFYSVGVFAKADIGDVNIDVVSVSTQGDLAGGVVALAGQFYNYVTGLTYGGDIAVRTGGVTTTGNYATGIFVGASSGNVSIESGTVHVSGVGSDGIVAVTGYTGDVGVVLSGDTISDHGSALVISSAGSATVTIGQGGAPVVSGGAAGILVETTDGVTINNNGVLTGGGGFAVGALGGAATINNAGSLRGFMLLTDSTDTVNNSGGWLAFGDSDFGDGVDSVSNSGQLVVGAASVRFKNLENFANSGLIDLRNGYAGDVLDLGAAAFSGSGASTLAVDVGFTDPNHLMSDKLVIGAASGTTNLIVQGRGVLGSTVVVDATSGTAGAFQMAGGGADTGLVRLSLAYDATNADWSLVGSPDIEAFETLKLGGAAQNLWRRGGEAWSVRMQQARDGDGEGDGSGLWGQYVGGNQDEDSVQSFNALGSTYSEDLSTRNRWNGGQVGGDMRRGPWTFGATAGYAAQFTSFTADNNQFRLSGVNAGAYGGWQSGGFYAQGLVDYLRFRADVNLASAGLRRNVHGDAWGAKGETGYRHWMGAMYIEPSVSLAWTHTSLDDLTGAGATVEYDGADSLQGAAGARIGGSFGSGQFVLRPYLGLYAVNEFSGDNGIRFATGATGFNVTDDPAGTYGKAVFGVSAGGELGMQVFVAGEADFGDVSGVNGQAGLRWRW